MYVFIHYNDLKIDVFGPSTPQECDAWLRMKKIHSRTNVNTTIKPMLPAHDCVSKKLHFELIK